MQNLNLELLERGAKFLQNEDIIKRMDADTQAAIREGRKEFYLADFFIRKELESTSGIVDFLKATDVLEVGINNLDKGKLPEGTYMALLAVGVGYGFAATASEADTVRFASSEYLNTIPTKIMNSEFTLKNGDKRILACRTAKFFANAFADYGVEANDENNVVLPQPKLLEHKKDIKIGISFPANGTLTIDATHKYFLEVRLVGVVVGDRV